MTAPITTDRPPRIQPELPLGEYPIPKPVNKPDEGAMRLVEIGLPLITIIGYVFVAAIAGSNSLGLLIPMALAVVASVAFAIYSFRKEKQRSLEAERMYANRLIELNKEMHTYHDLQRRFYRYNYPDAAAALQIVQRSRQEAERAKRGLRSEARLWERRNDDDDFGIVRLGIGTLPSTVTYTLSEIENYSDPQARAAMKLATDSRYVNEIPVIIALRPPAEQPDDEQDEQRKAAREALKTPVAHALGVAGERSAVYAFTRAMLAHYSSFHPPSDAKVYLLASQREQWAWAADLPHARNDDQNDYQCFTNDIKPLTGIRGFDDDDGGELEQFLEGIRKIVAQRKIRLQEREESQATSDPTLPQLLIVVDLLDATNDPTSPLQGVEADAALSIVIEEGDMLGAAVVFLVPDRGKIPSSCRGVVEIEQTSPATNSAIAENQKLHFRYAEVGVNTPRYVGEADSADQTTLEQLAEAMAAVQIRQNSGATLINAVPFLDLMGFSSLNDLTASAWQRWQASEQPRYANWLRVKLGMMAGNKPRTMVFSAKRDGVHGLVAGSTGSGKSELLISLIAGMAITYHPTVLNFVLVDYKGGGAFKEFVDLPHCVDIITNLAADGVTRMFTAIQAEMRRRQALNAETGTKNIVEYRQKGLHLSHQPYPFLFIIIDEFAEMIADRAEYKYELESIARVGRAQGVSMILAAQRPTGVTDQMRSNIKYRISLRVETPAESREMLRRADAAFLPAGISGRGYLQVGNEEIELMQVAYTGDRYVDPAKRPSNAPVLWPDRHPGVAQAAQDQQPPELYKAIIDALDALAKTNSMPPQHAPWPGFLPKHLALSEPLIDQNPHARAVTAAHYLHEIDSITLGAPAEPTLTLNPAINHWLEGACGWHETLDWQEYALRPVIGLVDNPYAARQVPLVIDLPRGHVVVFGASGSGKTTFIRTLLFSLAASHSPNAFHAYILDLGGRSLSVLGDLPHVGAVVLPDEEGYEERVGQIMREIEEIVERRKFLLSAAGATDIYQYNQAHPESLQPAIVVAIDNFGEFYETFGGSESDNPDSVLNLFIGLARQSKPYGVHLVISATQIGGLSTQMLSLFSERFTLRLVDAGDYRAIVGGNVAEIGDIAGRGYARIGRQALAFQVAIPVEVRRATNGEMTSELKELSQLAQQIKQYTLSSGQNYSLPVRVDALPKAVLFKQLLAREHGLSLTPSFLGQLSDATRQQWAASTDPAHADWLKVLIGVASGDRLRTLSLEAKKDGVHGMVAGGTGAGKSELLMTLIVGLALRYDPSILNFVLIDYKGGGAFAPFARLPHCVDTITNLNKSAVKRMFTAISAEMRRRQRLNAETGTKDIVEYRQKGLHLSHQPYPHLFIIIDEFAEMISSSPEFGEELDSITRVGRAQGVNLLLAAQRPIGVSDQMRANIKLRMCLRVEGADTSREMLRRPDAAFLPNGMPGRGYIQVGNEQVELVQVAYTGETFQDAQPNESGEKPKFYDVVVQLSNDLLRGPRPMTPWPPFLPPTQTFADPLRSRYLDKATEARVTLGRSNKLTLNPFLQEWLDGNGAWHTLDWNKTAMRAIAGLVDDPYSARLLPLTVDFTRGHAVIFGASGWGKTTMLRSLILSLAATHSPDQFQAHMLDLGGRNLEVLRALPQVGTVIMPDERGYEERVQQLWRELGEIIDTRKRLFSTAGVSTLIEYNDQSGANEPAILIVIDNFAEFIETFGGGAQADDENSLLATFVALARQGRAYGIHVVITCNRLNVLSSKLYSLFTERYTLRLSDPDDYSGIVGMTMPEIDEIPGRGYTRVDRMALSFQVALPPGAVDDQGLVRGEARQIRAIGQQMVKHVEQSSQRYRQPLRIDALPKSSSFRQILIDERGISNDQRFLDELHASTAQMWQHNAAAEHADWLKLTLGITSGNRRRTLSLEAKKDGVHGMVAGGTGSGKSELLMTLIVGLALNYSPDILNFVLVDYKGGGAFKPFDRLPHCVDIVTNLNTAAVARMFTAINAEIRRRQALNAETGTKDIVEYRARGFHKTREPYPHLFVIIDEYAEMIDQNDEYLRQIESITRVGRAQGINLLLASQQPKGVTDQMRANIKLRLCLRVEQLETSRELLRRPDAALLPNGMPGRGYMQIGNENLELIQVAYTGENQPDNRAARVLWPERPQRSAASDGEVPKLFDMAVQIALELVGGQAAPKPWPAFLPESFTLETVLNDAQHNRQFTLLNTVTDWLNGDTDGLWPALDWHATALRPVVGLLDDPAEARQEPLSFDLTRNHLAVFGDSGMGKTSLLRTIMVSLAATHSPDDIHFYVIDLGGRNYRSLEALPQLGAAIYADDETFDERLLRLLDFLGQTIDQRQQRFSTADCSNLADYNTRFPAEALPAIVLLIDNIAALQENYEALIDGLLMPLARRSLGVGITLIVATNLPTQMPSRLYGLFGERVTLKQASADTYLDIVGRGTVELGETPGRGYIRRDRRPLTLQVALPIGLLAAGGRPLRPEAEELRQLSAHMQQHAATRGQRSQPNRVQILPELVLLQSALEHAPAAQPRQIQAVLGQGGNLQPALIDLRQSGPHFLIVGPPLSGKTVTLQTWALALAARYSPETVRLVLIDFQQALYDYGGDHTLGDLPHTLACVGEIEQVSQLVAQLQAECSAMVASEAEGGIFVLIDNFDDFSDEIERQHELANELVLLLRRFGRSGLHFIVAATPEGSPSEFRRRIQSANFGLGLRTAAAIETLRVMRTPAAIRDKELPIGRGYIVKSGQTSLVQIATPIEPNSVAPDPNDDASALAADALDRWVEQAQAAYPGQQATWQAPAEAPPAAATATPLQQHRSERMLAVLQAGMRRELAALHTGNGEQSNGEAHQNGSNGTEITTQLLDLDSAQWNDPQALVGLLKALYIKNQQADGLDPEIAKSMTDYLDEESLLLALESANE